MGMTGYCVSDDHADCPDAHEDTNSCDCPCHLIGDAVEAVANRG